MTFLELAEKIDQAKSVLHAAESALSVAEAAVAAVQARHATELSAAQATVADRKLDKSSHSHGLSTLFAEMHKLMGTHVGDASPSAGPSPAELKQLFLDGQKARAR